MTGDLWVYQWTAGAETVIVAINRGAAVGALAIEGTAGTWTSALGTGSLAGGKLTIGAGEAAIFTK